MKTIDLSDATAPLAEYVKQMDGDPLMIMHKGVALAVLAPAGNDDYESVQMSTNPEFIALLEQSRKSIREGRSFSGEEARKLFLGDDKDG